MSTGQRFSLEDKARGLWLWDSGWPVDEAAADIGTAQQSLYAWRKDVADGKLKLPLFSPPTELLVERARRRGDQLPATGTEPAADDDNGGALELSTGSGVPERPEVVPASELVRTKSDLRAARDEHARTKAQLDAANEAITELRVEAVEAKARSDAALDVAATELADERAKTRAAVDRADTFARSIGYLSEVKR